MTMSNRKRAAALAGKAFDIVDKIYFDPNQDPFKSSPALREKILDHLQSAIDLLKSGTVGAWAQHRRTTRKNSRRRTSRRMR